MSREETKVKTFDILRFIADNAGLSMFEAIEKAYNMGLSEQEPKTGHWIDKFGGCECSECGCLEAGYSDYCPNCGAKMVEPQKSEGV